MNLDQINIEIANLKTRNKLVEQNKAWEISVFRKVMISILTYFVIVLFFVFADLPKPFINAIVPTLGFMLSTLSLGVFKKIWLKYIKKTSYTPRHKITPSSYFIPMRDNEVLLLLRQNTGYADNQYSFIAGHAEKDDCFSDCIIREAKEEAGIEIKKEDLEVLHIMERHQRDDERMDVFFTAKKWDGEITNKEPHKCKELKWFPLDKLPENTIPYIRKVLTNIREKKVFDEYGYD